jgi:hypothetical protein
VSQQHPDASSPAPRSLSPTPAYVSIRQHTSAYVSIRQRMLLPQHPGPYLQRLPNKPALTANLRGLVPFSSASSPSPPPPHLLLRLLTSHLSLFLPLALALSLSVSLTLSLFLTKLTSKAKVN